MGTKITRRDMLRNVGAVGATGVLLSGPGASLLAAETPAEQQLEQSPSSIDLLKAHENYTATITAGEMIVQFDLRYGSISSITRKNDPFQTNYIGNEINCPGVNPADSRWTGDVVSTVWELNTSDWKNAKINLNDVFRYSGKWRRELTGKSEDIRRVRFSDDTLNVKYEGSSSNDEGIHSYTLQMNFGAGPGSSLLWDIEIGNATSGALEIGELGFPLMVNDDYDELYIDHGTENKLSTVNNVDFGKTPLRQKLIHEQKVLVHHFVAGHSSYVLVQRPLGDPPFLLVHPTMETSFECIYRDPKSAFTGDVHGWDGPDILAVHSWATKNQRNWRRNPWVNGHTSMILQPGEKKKFQLRFAFIPSYDAIRDELYEAGNLGIRVLPSMVVQEDTNALVELKTKSDIGEIDLLSDNILIKEKKRVHDKTLLTLSFKGRGQKSLKLHYGENRWTNLHFYCIEDVEGLLNARGKFVVERQFYDDPKDPYHRHHGFLPFDHRIGSMFLDADEVWEVGGSDESGFSEPLFLAEKNVHLPSRKEVETLETYVADCLFKYIQNPETYEVRASLYWKDRYPSSGWGAWTKARSEQTWRSYNYVHPANIYHALYRIGKSYGLLTRKSPEEYLRMSYRTCMKWFATGPWRHVGLMEGSNAIYILNDLQKEGWNEEYKNLRQQMMECNEEFLRDPYPYSSELVIDQTAHEQVYFFTRFFGNKEKNEKTIQVLKALRGGNQPVWFRYGNDKRRDVCCWYNASLNGMALLKAYEDHGDPDALIKGYAGVMSVMANVLPDGMGYNFFICTPGIFDHEPPRTFESGSGLWGFLRSSKSYVVKDPTFGEVGFGCKIESTDHAVTVYPKDGLRKRMRFVEAGIDVEVTQGQIKKASLDRGKVRLALEISDPTGLTQKAQISIDGLASGNYKVTHGKSSRNVSVKQNLTLSVPMQDAAHVEIEAA
jgi:Family of unknown function (DUF5695)